MAVKVTIGNSWDRCATDEVNYGQRSAVTDVCGQTHGANRYELKIVQVKIDACPEIRGLIRGDYSA